jgi:hypothetical protein
MKLRGKIVLQETAGRTDPWVHKTLNHDYFLAFEIEAIDGLQVSSCSHAFELLRGQLPTLTCDELDFTGALKPATLPRGAKDVLHITLGNFGDFRMGRDTDNNIDEDVLINAEALNGKNIEIELKEKAFGFLNTSEHASELKAEGSHVTYAPKLGPNRDTILNLEPTQKEQDKLGAYAKQVFGEDFVLWNANKQPVPYHVTLAEANINPMLASHFDFQDLEPVTTSLGF